MNGLRAVRVNVADGPNAPKPTLVEAPASSVKIEELSLEQPPEPQPKPIEEEQSAPELPDLPELPELPAL